MAVFFKSLEQNKTFSKLQKYYFGNLKLANVYLKTQNRSFSEATTSIQFSNGEDLKLSSNKFARMADGCAVAKIGRTSVMATTVSKTTPSSTNFAPLVVDCTSRAAAGRIPVNFLRRELGSSDTEILMARLVDRSLRPLFPEDYNYETQIICNMMQLDGANDPDVAAINAASTALSLSDIPWNGPVGAVRVGLVNNELLVNPSRQLLRNSMLDLVITGTKKNLAVMLEGSANNISEPDLKKSIKFGIKECQKIVQAIENFQKSHGKTKREFKGKEPLDEEKLDAIKCFSEAKLKEIFLNDKLDKMSRDNAVNNLRNEVLENMKKSYSDLDLTSVVEALGKFAKEIMRNLTFSNNVRCDGRGLNNLRDISCEADLFDLLHGSALFQRGQTQVLCKVTLDSIERALKMDMVSMLTSGIKEKNFFLHYEFPPFATNETGRSGNVGRRELGHGALAERGLRAVLPDDYPFTIRLNSQVLESNGSSSMASVCGGSLALMDAGVPISSHAAGVAIGLFTKYGTNENGEKQIEDYRILTDLLGIEDYAGDMDFKVAGTKKGVTALQADIKIPGLPLKILFESLERATEAKSKILNIMNKTISAPRESKKENTPVTEKIQVPIHQQGKFIGHGGQNFKRILNETGVQIYSGDDTTFTLFAPNESSMKEAKEIIDTILTRDYEQELEKGGTYPAKIVELRDNGVMVQLYPNMKPTLLPNSQLGHGKILHPSALNLKVGQAINVKYFGRDPVSGQMRISEKAITSVTNMFKDLFKR